MEITLEGLSLGWFANTVTMPDFKYFPLTSFQVFLLRWGSWGVAREPAF